MTLSKKARRLALIRKRAESLTRRRREAAISELRFDEPIFRRASDEDDNRSLDDILDTIPH